VKSALLMGLCGGLTPQYPVGTAVLCETCQSWDQSQPALLSDRTLNNQLLERIPTLPLVSALTSQNLLCRADEKQALASDRHVDIVEMEGYSLFSVLQAAGIQVSMLRVVSDDCDHNVPDVSNAISPDGSLRPIPLAMGFLRHPLGAARLIRGSLTGLQQLERCAAAIFKP
jgi:nucleoside phosphorylase